MSGGLSLLGAGGVALGAVSAAAALVRGEQISTGRRALIAAALLCAPGALRRARRQAPAVLVPAAGMPAGQGPAEHRGRDFVLSPAGPDGHMVPVRFRVVAGRIRPYTLRADGTWIPGDAGQTRPGQAAAG